MSHTVDATHSRRRGLYVLRSPSRK